MNQLQNVAEITVTFVENIVNFATFDGEPADMFDGCTMSSVWFKLKQAGFDVEIIVGRTQVNYEPRIGNVYETPVEHTVLAYRKSSNDTH
jgi:hypothetical protein